MRKVLWLVVIFLLSFAGTALAQGTIGTISGTLKDRNEALIPNVKVEVVNEGDGTVRPVYTDLRGRYSLSSLSPGNYRVTGTLEGFKDASRDGVVVVAGKNTVVDLQMLGDAPDGGRGGRLRPGSVTIPPFHIVGNIYYVGLNDTASFLITTPQGNILIDADFASAPPYIRENIEQLGFKMKDIKILLVSHEHPDHVGGMAQMKEMTGAQLFAMQGADTILEDGGRSAPGSHGKQQFAPVKVDRVLHDQEKVQLGGVTLVANLTAGHTKGCTTWSTVEDEKGKKYHVVILCSSSMNANTNLINNEDWPNISEAWAAGFKRLKSLPCDIPLGDHERFYNMLAKRDIMLHNPNGPNPFIDPAGYKAYVDISEKQYLAQLQRQRAGDMPKKSAE